MTVLDMETFEKYEDNFELVNSILNYFTGILGFCYQLTVCP